jgi:hypothetical protein
MISNKIAKNIFLVPSSFVSSNKELRELKSI